MFSGQKSNNRGKVIIMDEVDGMSAGDRGGSAELIQLIKKTKTPIICICNDRSSPKIRSLANHCLDLRFRRPTAQQVEARLRVIANREQLELKPNVIGELVAATSCDIRQMLNLLSTYKLNASVMTFDDSKKLGVIKNVTMTPFDVTSKLFNRDSFRSASLGDKIELYFQDFSIIPLMIQENYIKMNPAFAVESRLTGKKAVAKHLELLGLAAESISFGDVLESVQRQENSWSLLPVHAAISTVRPCFFTHGSMSGMYGFAGWLGQNSKQTKAKRLTRELQTHMRLHTCGDKHEIRMQYLPYMAPRLTKPLLGDESGVDTVIEFMDQYYITREDWDSIMDLGYQDLIQNIPTKTKTLFTRTYNKMTHLNPFAPSLGKPKKERDAGDLAIPDSEEVLEPEAIEEEEEEEEEIIVKPKPSKGKKAAKPSKGKKK